MASRNERKRRAKARHAELVKAANAIWREQAKPKPPTLADTLNELEALGDCEAGTISATLGNPRLCRSNEKGRAGGKSYRTRDYAGKVVKGKLVRTIDTGFEPLRHDGNSSGYGQRRIRYVK